MARARLEATIGLKTGRFRRELSRVMRMTQTFAMKMRAIGSSVMRMGRQLRRAFLVGATGIVLAIREGDKFRRSMAMVNTMLESRQPKMYREEIEDLGRAMGNVNMVFKPKAGTLGSELKEAQLSAESLEEAMARRGSMDTIEGMTEGVRKLSAELGIAKTELAEGLYQTLSASVPPQNAIAFLAEAAKAGVGGATDIKTAVDGLTTVINAFGLQSSDVTKIADQMFTAVKRGKTTFEELAGNIGQVANIASVAGVETSELFAAYATLTRQGIKTDKASTGLRQAMIALLKPSEDLKKKFKDLKTSGTELLKEKGIQGAFQAIVDLAGGSNEELVKLIPNIRALPAVLGLTGQKAADAENDLAAMAEAGGKAAEAFKKMDTARQWPRLWQSILGLVERFGDTISRVVQPAVDGLSKMLQKMADSPKFNSFLERVGRASKGIVGGIGALLQGGDQKALALSGFKDIIVGAFQTAGAKIVEIMLKAAPVIGLAIGKGFKEGSKLFGTGKSFQEEVAAAMEKGEGFGKAFRDAIGPAGKELTKQGFEKIQQASDNFMEAAKKFTDKQVGFVDELGKTGKQQIEELLEGANQGKDPVGGIGSGKEFSSLRRIGANVIAQSVGNLKQPEVKKQTNLLEKMLRESKEQTKAFKERVERRGIF